MTIPDVGTGEGNILIVDDTVVNLRNLSSMLSHRGYDVRTASSGQAALELCEEAVPDLVLLDVRMPEMSGYEVCQHLKANPATQDVPILFLSAQSALADIIQGFQVGGVDYIAKPVQMPEVLARVQTHLTLHNLQRQLAAQNAQLTHEVAERQQAEAALQRVNEELEQRVAERTAELAQANANLRASIAIFRYLFEQAQDGYLVVNQDRRITYANPQARLYLDLQGNGNDRDFMDLLIHRYHCEPQSAWDVWRKALAKGTGLSQKPDVPMYLVRPETATSRSFWLQVTVLDVSGGADSMRSIVQLRDVTEQTTLQDELNKFHSMIMHKLRTPLVPLYSGLQFLVSNVQTMQRDDMAAFLDDAFQGIQRLYDEIEDVIQYLDVPTVALDREACALTALPSTVAHVADELGLKMVTVSGLANVDATHLVLSQRSVELMLWEILENTKKFHPQQSPHVDVRVASCCDEQQVSIQVQDDGLTLSPQQLVQMWTPYYQGDKYATGQMAGMGLGLSLVATQVWSVGGTCRAFNRQDGAGIVVELIIPTRQGFTA